MEGREGKASGFGLPKLSSSVPQSLPAHRGTLLQTGREPAHPTWDEGGSGASPSHPARGSPREPPAGPSLLAGKADPVLLTGDWRSRCPASPSSALGSCAAGLMLGIDKESQSRARIHAGSSTRTRKEPTAFLQERGSPPAPLFSSHRTRQARGSPVPPATEVAAGSHGAEVPPGPGTKGQGCRDTETAGREGKPRPSARRGRRQRLPRRGAGPARISEPRAHSRPRMPFQIWRGWPDSVKGGVGLQR